MPLRARTRSTLFALLLWDLLFSSGGSGCADSLGKAKKQLFQNSAQDHSGSGGRGNGSGGTPRCPPMLYPGESGPMDLLVSAPPRPADRSHGPVEGGSLWWRRLCRPLTARLREISSLDPLVSGGPAFFAARRVTTVVSQQQGWGPHGGVASAVCLRALYAFSAGNAVLAA